VRNTATAAVAAAATTALAAVAGAAGCTAMSTVKTATTVPRGETVVIAAVEGNGGAPMELPVKPLLPEAVIGVRHGVGDRVDVGAKLTTLPLGRRVTTAGVEGQVKVQLRRRDDSRLQLALGPAAGFRWISTSGAAMQVSYATLPLILGIDVGRRRHQIVVAPEVGLQLWTSAGASKVWAPVAGLTLGFVWRIGHRFTLIPEATAYRSTVAIDHSRGTMMIHLGVGMQY
jgi:hypothetical protein